MGQKFAKKFRGMSRCCTQTSSNESLTNVSSLFGTRTLNSDTSVFSSIAASLPEPVNSNQKQKDDVSDKKIFEENVDTKSDSPTLSEDGSDAKSNQFQEDTEDAKENYLCLCEPFRTESPNSVKQNPIFDVTVKTTSSQSLNTESCPCSDSMCSSFFTRTSRSLSSLTRLLDHTHDIFQCPCILCSSYVPQTPSFVTIFESNLLESVHSSSTNTSASVSSNSEMSKTTISTNFSDMSQPSDNTSSLCRTDTLSCTCTSKNSGSLSSMPTTSTTCTGSSLYSSGSSNTCSSCDSNTDSSNGTARSSSSGISLCTLFGST